MARLLLLLVLIGAICAAAAASSPLLPAAETMRVSFAGKSEFRTVNRKPLGTCLDPSPYLEISVSTGGAPLPDEAFLNVTVSGVRRPDRSHWLAMITPSNSR